MDLLEIKSTGILIDEMFTTEMKLAAGNEEAKERRHTLGNIITGRTIKLLDDMDKYRAFQAEMLVLKSILQDLWNCEETITAFPSTDECASEQLYELATTAQRARKLNALRNKSIRRLDELNNESGRAPLEKTYS